MGEKQHPAEGYFDREFMRHINVTVGESLIRRIPQMFPPPKFIVRSYPTTVVFVVQIVSSVFSNNDAVGQTSGATRHGRASSDSVLLGESV